MKWATAFLCIFIVGLQACSSTSIQNTPEIDPAWKGTWKGKAIVDNSSNPTKEVTLEIEFTSTHIAAFYSDSFDKITRLPVHNLSLKEHTISFRVAYDDAYALTTTIECLGTRTGNIMAVVMKGRQAGKAFQGKWQARLVDE